jgi:hypothetical protein
MENIPRLGEIKSKPKIGEIRLTIDGTRRKIFDGKCWQYLCTGDLNCRIQAKSVCRYHRKYTNEISMEKSSLNQTSQLKPGDTQDLPNGNRRIWRGARWHSLCRAKNCLLQAKDFCKTHQNQRMSLPNTNLNISPKSRSIARTRSLILHDKTDKVEESQSQDESSPSIEVPTNKRRRIDENTLETVAISPTQKRELHTRNGRRVRCNGLIWKHLCADKKTGFYKRKYQRQSVPIKKSDPITETDQNTSDKLSTLSSDTPIEPSPITRNSKKRKTTGDITNEEHIVPKRRGKGSNKLIPASLEQNSSNTSVFDVLVKEKSIEEPVLSDSDVSLSLKSNRFHTNYQSIEIPVQSSSPFSYDSSTSAILEQFGTIIKKEAIVEEESLICVPPMVTNEFESPCETLQDFLRAEEIKTKEFKLDCQRISYRLAKIQDCIGSISSITN